MKLLLQSCRRSRKTYDEGCEDVEDGWCIAVGDMADYVVETNKGSEYITREEALDIFRRAEENGFVHQITNIDGEKLQRQCLLRAPHLSSF